MLSLAWVSMGGMSWPVIASLGKWSMRPGARSRAPSTVPQASLGTRPQVAPAELSNVPGHCALDVHGGKLSLKTCKRTSHGVEEPSPSTNGDPRPVVHRQGCLHRTAGTAKPCRSNPSLTSKAIPDSHPDLSPNAPLQKHLARFTLTSRRLPQAQVTWLSPAGTHCSCLGPSSCSPPALERTFQ